MHYKNNHNKAIEYYIESLNSIKDTDGYLLTIFSIIKEYSKQKNIDKVIEWCEKGLNLLDTRTYQTKIHSYLSSL